MMSRQELIEELLRGLLQKGRRGYQDMDLIHTGILQGDLPLV